MSLRANFFLLSILLILASCESPVAIEIPEGTLSESEMVDILTDMHLVEGAKVGNKIMGDTLRAPVYYKKVYNKYGITEQKFETDFRFYSTHPEMMTKVYEKVIENLNKIEIAPPKDGAVDEITREQTSVGVTLKDLNDAKAKLDADSAQIE